MPGSRMKKGTSAPRNASPKPTHDHDGAGERHREHTEQRQRARQPQRGRRAVILARGHHRHDDESERLRDDQHELGDRLRDGVVADRRERSKPGQHEHVEAPREEAEHLPDRDPPAVAERRRARGAATGGAGRSARPSARCPRSCTSEISDAAIRPPAMPQLEPGDERGRGDQGAHTAEDVEPVRERERAPRVEQARGEELDVHERDEGGHQPPQPMRRSRSPWWSAIQPPASRTVANDEHAEHAAVDQREPAQRGLMAQAPAAKYVIAVGVPSPARLTMSTTSACMTAIRPAAGRPERAREQDRGQ